MQNLGQFEKNYEEVMERIAKAAERSGRKAHDVALVAVSKTVEAKTVNRVIRAGARILGESRGQELALKYQELIRPEGLSIHFIGHLQTNKVKQVVPMVDVVESVDSERLAAELNRQCRAVGKVMDIFMQVKILADPNKSGLSPEELYPLLERMGNYRNIRVTGLMAIPPLLANDAEKRGCFSQMRKLFVDTKGKKYDNVYMNFLSMGMSSDFEMAIEEGANAVRVGSLIFGERK